VRPTLVLCNKKIIVMESVGNTHLNANDVDVSWRFLWTKW